MFYTRFCPRTVLWTDAISIIQIVSLILLSKTLIWPFTISPNGDGGGDDDETMCRRSESSKFLQYSSIATRKYTYAK